MLLHNISEPLLDTHVYPAEEKDFFSFSLAVVTAFNNNDGAGEICVFIEPAAILGEPEGRVAIVALVSNCAGLIPAARVGVLSIIGLVTGFEIGGRTEVVTRTPAAVVPTVGVCCLIPTTGAVPTFVTGFGTRIG